MSSTYVTCVSSFLSVVVVILQATKHQVLRERVHCHLKKWRKAVRMIDMLEKLLVLEGDRIRKKKEDKTLKAGRKQ